MVEAEFDLRMPPRRAADGHARRAAHLGYQSIPSVHVLSRVPVEHRPQGAVIGISENSSQSNFIFEQNLSRNLIRLRTPENSLGIHRIGPTGTLEVRNQSFRNQLVCIRHNVILTQEVLCQ